MMPPVEEERRMVIRVEMVPSLAIVGATGRRAKRVAEITGSEVDIRHARSVLTGCIGTDTLKHCQAILAKAQTRLSTPS